MPLKDHRTKASTHGKNKTAGRIVVSYRNAAGKTFDALVVSQGTSSGLKLVLRSPAGAFTAGARVLDNVAVATGVKSLNAYTVRN
jgi:hypothetical protein